MRVVRDHIAKPGSVDTISCGGPRLRVKFDKNNQASSVLPSNNSILILFSTMVTIYTTSSTLKYVHFVHRIYSVFRMVLAINSDCFPKQH
jgi:hypothetical protein